MHMSSNQQATISAGTHYHEISIRFPATAAMHLANVLRLANILYFPLQPVLPGAILSFSEERNCRFFNAFIPLCFQAR